MELEDLRKLRTKLKELEGPCNDHKYDLNYEDIEYLLGEYGLRILYRRPIDTLIFECMVLDESTGNFAMVADEEDGDLHQVILWTSYGKDEKGKYVFRVDI
jgi:hypothetical protein